MWGADEQELSWGKTEQSCALAPEGSGQEEATGLVLCEEPQEGGAGQLHPA